MTGKKLDGGVLVLQVVLGLAGVLLASQPAHAESDRDGNRSSVGGDIVIQKGETARNVACVACSVYVHGEVDGKVAVVMGNVVVDGIVREKVAIVMGDLKMQPGGVVQGDTAIVMGGTDMDGGSVEGRSVNLPKGPIVFALLMPFLLLALVIWLIVWVIRRSRSPRYPYPPPMPPPGV
jgi:cytoskeletal protein CcmA (bactofilin family)